jgi:hypothetical protein
MGMELRRDRETVSRILLRSAEQSAPPADYKSATGAVALQCLGQLPRILPQ